MTGEYQRVAVEDTGRIQVGAWEDRGDARRHTETHGYIHVDTQGHRGTHGDTRRYTRRHTEIHGDTRRYAEIRGDTREYKEARGVPVVTPWRLRGDVMENHRELRNPWKALEHREGRGRPENVGLQS